VTRASRKGQRWKQEQEKEFFGLGGRSNSLKTLNSDKEMAIF